MTVYQKHYYNSIGNFQQMLLEKVVELRKKKKGTLIFTLYHIQQINLKCITDLKVQLLFLGRIRG